VIVPEAIRDAFGATGDVETLPGSATYRVGDLVLKKLAPDSLENDRSLDLAPWLFGALCDLPQSGFIVPKPVRSSGGRWVLEGAWTASQFVFGHPMTPVDTSAVLLGIRALHRQLAAVDQHPALATNSTAWGVAHRECWASHPPPVQPELQPLLDQLFARLEPVPALRSQLIHGDLNTTNILVEPSGLPIFLDFTPFWAPADFAIAMFANWAGPRSNNLRLLEQFRDEPHFQQLLLRASIRMLLVVAHLDGLQDWDSERRAAQLVLEVVDASAPPAR
jgi:Ser/Thr protein kinase RdoA (MazF antagonist)